ncbi:hypothetical protein [Glycomyces buryatensis]|uniref:hypothetical protein n=1 Tax=Glycomyces buryatensis TaxID=2570927 RepID=UPI00145627AD|nr:hypothetical protein [Glycomyces buryatensis]
MTATSLALAAWWPDGQTAGVVEVDPTGGDVAARWGVPFRPGLVEVAAAADAGGVGEEPLVYGVQHLEVVGRRVGVVCAPPGGRQVAAALPVVSPPASKALNPAAGVALADVGRLWPESPVWNLVEYAEVAVLLVEGSVSAVAHMRSHLAGLSARRAGPVLVVCAGGEYLPSEVAAALAEYERAEVLGAMPAPEVVYGAVRGRARRRAAKEWARLASTVAERLRSVPKAALAVEAHPTGAADGDR